MSVFSRLWTTTMVIRRIVTRTFDTVLSYHDKGRWRLDEDLWSGKVKGKRPREEGRWIGSQGNHFGTYWERRRITKKHNYRIRECATTLDNESKFKSMLQTNFAISFGWLTRYRFVQSNTLWRHFNFGSTFRMRTVLVYITW